MTSKKIAPALRERAEHYRPEGRPPDLCRSGQHLMVGDNLIVRPNGRQCRACKVEADRRYRQRKGEELTAKKREYYDQRERDLRRQHYAADPDYAERRRQYNREAYQRRRIRRAGRVVCAHGHDLSQPGAVYVRPNGTKRECVACRRDQRRRWRENHPEQERAYNRAWMRRHRAQQKES
ncbi:hypothetical protein [Kocuria rosea]|uniref:hypothetical protein n=1 Tax=Kocuria rosea TaxID=1275 RepID=UPI0011A562C4|nr:hypothetical protein [Kocuria rosea]